MSKDFKPLKFEDLEISDKDLKNIVLGSQLFLSPLDESDEEPFDLLNPPDPDTEIEDLDAETGEETS